MVHQTKPLPNVYSQNLVIQYNPPLLKNYKMTIFLYLNKYHPKKINKQHKSYHNRFNLNPYIKMNFLINKMNKIV